ncbi:MAG TPA: SprT family zinc-dependent metalloprotease [Ottowia sp.]|uniref:M48 family metallopeptidase n=1 Tax=Ottowia sp. TaxID=1898956 RepID=UPI002C5C7A28|nr:SprT family zinc-dependent metalloprotease [Ottowia sp.]HMN21743.1 SprT family zinc-dependent metalloprotease [Ottowia sp.]
MQALQFDLFSFGTAASDPREPATPGEPAHAAPLASVTFAHPRANREIRLGQARISYALLRGRRRTIGLAIDVDGLRVQAPRWTSIAEIEAALHARTRWILDKLATSHERQRALAAARIDWHDGATLPYLGQPLRLQLDPRQRHGRAGAVLAVGSGTPATLWIGLPRGATPEQLRDTTQAWLLGQARRHFSARLDLFAPRLDVRWHRLTLSSARTRWGSASADGSIRLNWRLIHFSPALIDYVVVHELAHLREMNHSARFWQHVESVLPDYGERRGALREALAPAW